MSNDFFNEHDEESEDQDLFYAVEQYQVACENGLENELTLSEDEFEFIIEHFMIENNSEQVLKASMLAFAKHPYSSDLLAKYADSLIVAGDVDKAVSVLKEYKDSFDNNSDICFLFTRAYIKKSLFTAARDYFVLAISMDLKAEDVVDSIWSLGQDCVELEEYNEAIYYFNKAFSLDSKNNEYLNDIAFCYDKLNQIKKALHFYNQYLDRDPFNDYVWFNIGTVYARQREFDKAIEAFEYSLALNPKNDSSVYNLAVVYLNLDRYKEALEYFKRCYDIDGHSAASSLGIADAYLGLKDLTKAKDFFLEAIDSDESCEDAQMGYDCVMAIEQYLQGEKHKFMEQIKVIAKKDSTWVNTLYSIFPQLGSEGDFLNLLTESRKPGS